MINKTQEATKLAILRKTPFAHGTRPGDDGMPAAQVKKLFYAAIADEQDSVLAEMERMRQEANAALDTKADLTLIVDEVPADTDHRCIPSVQGMIEYVERMGNAYRYFYTGLSVPAEAWQELDTAEGDFAYCARIDLPHVTARAIPEVYYAPVDLARSQLATYCRSTDGGVLLYSTQAIDTPVTVEAVVCWVPTFYVVLVDAPHCTVRIADVLGHTYTHGAAVPAGQTIQVAVSLDTGYTAETFTLSGQTYSISATPTVTVWDSVRVACTATGGDE